MWTIAARPWRAGCLGGRELRRLLRKCLTYRGSIQRHRKGWWRGRCASITDRPTPTRGASFTQSWVRCAANPNRTTRAADIFCFVFRTQEAALAGTVLHFRMRRQMGPLSRIVEIPTRAAPATATGLLAKRPRIGSYRATTHFLGADILREKHDNV